MSPFQSIDFRTAFANYRSDSVLGEGGAGTVYGATDESGGPVAVKVLDPRKATRERLKRFKNEYLFGFQNQHQNLLRVVDFGVVDRNGVAAPFYVMMRYAGSLRVLMRKGISPVDVFPLFERILSGVEAAHLLKVTHRDIKPENILVNSLTDLVIGDFGIARFEEDELYTAVETKNGERLANFTYAAPEQRKRGGIVDQRADIFALGLMLNELFTGEVPQGTDFRKVGSLAVAYAWIDEVVETLIRFDPDARPSGVAAIRELLRIRSSNFDAQQKLSSMSKTVINAAEIDDPLASEPPTVVGADFDGQQVIITLDRPVNAGWVDALKNIGSYTSAMNAGPERFTFNGAQARVPSRGDDAQQIINYFKEWLPRATAMYRQRLTVARERDERERRESLERQRKELERRQQIRKSLTF